MISRRFLVVPFAAACAALPAQEQPAPAPAAPLVLETMDASVARRVCRMFAPDAELPRPGADMHFVLTMDEGGGLIPSTAQGDVGFLKLRANPGLLMDIFAERIDTVRALAQGSGTTVMTQMGMPPGEAIKIMRAMFDFPKQIAVVDAVVRADPDRPEDGVDVSLDLVPAAGSWFGSFVADLRPGKRGAPVLRAPAALMTAEMSFDMKRLVEHIEPLLAIAVSLCGKGKGKDHAETLAPLLRRSWDAYDGTGAFVWEPDSGMRILSGLSDPAALGELMKDPLYLELMQRLQFMASEVELDPEARSYRDLPVQKLVVKMDEDRAMPTGPNPMFKDGEMTTWSCIAGDYLVAVTDPSPKQVEAMVDAVLDGKVERAPLGGDRVMRMTMALGAFIEAMSGGMLPPMELPERVEVDLAGNGKRLSVRVAVR